MTSLSGWAARTSSRSSRGLERRPRRTFGVARFSMDGGRLAADGRRDQDHPFGVLRLSQRVVGVEVPLDVTPQDVLDERIGAFEARPAGRSRARP